MIDNLQERLSMLETAIQQKNIELAEQAEFIENLQLEKEDISKKHKDLEKSYRLLESNHNRHKKAKKQQTKDFKLEMNTIRHKYNDMVGESGAKKKSLQAQRAEALIHQNLSDSVNDLCKAIKNMMSWKLEDNQLLVQKLNRINALSKEINEKDKTIAKLNAMLAVQKYDTKKFCATKWAESSQNLYKAAKECRLKSKKEHDRKEQQKKTEHNNKLE